MGTFYIKQNDTAPNLLVTLKDGSGNGVNVIGATVVFNLRDGKTKAQKINDGSCTLINGAGGTVQYVWGSGDTNTPGVWLGEFQVTYSGGGIETFPNNKANTLYIVVTSELS
jgi:hypothetical protein